MNLSKREILLLILAVKKSQKEVINLIRKTDDKYLIKSFHKDLIELQALEHKLGDKK